MEDNRESYGIWKREIQITPKKRGKIERDIDRNREIFCVIFNRK